MSVEASADPAWWQRAMALGRIVGKGHLITTKLLAKARRWGYRLEVARHALAIADGVILEWREGVRK